MLFSSFEFILLFWPATLLLFVVLQAVQPRARYAGQAAAGAAGAPETRRGFAHTLSLAWLVAASLVFYAWWSLRDLLLIVVSMTVNYGIARLLGPGARRSKTWLTVGVVANLAALGWFKYARFLAMNVSAVTGVKIHLPTIALPLAISFFTFQQIAYLVDAHRGKARATQPIDYALFVTFFPQLIAGPIVHHTDVMPQFLRLVGRGERWPSIASGVSLFVFGLFKKAVVADSLAAWVQPGFAAAAGGSTLSFWASWCAALAYTLQLYFDFSGYADMAVGAARTFGIELPINFDRPYQATSIAEFWRRWHMTLSRFLRDYLYIPLGGNRSGEARRYRNLMLTMLLGGLWHGAGWQFVVWGGLHGAYLVAEQWLPAMWGRAARAQAPAGGAADSAEHSERGSARAPRTWAWKAVAIPWTFLLVVIGWVFFRSSDLPSALSLLTSMFGGHGLGGASELPALAIPLLAGLTLFCWVGPDAMRINDWLFPPAAGRAPRSPALTGLATAFVAWISFLHMHQVSEFLYFQF